MKQNHWSLKYQEYVPEKQALREALCTLGNGYFATRGAFTDVNADDIHYPGTYLAGGYNRLKTEIVGKVIENEDLVNLPNWLCLNIKIGNGEWFRLRAIELLAFEQVLDLQRGVLKKSIRFQDASGRVTRLEETRLVHMQLYHLAAIRQVIVPENWSGTIEVLTALDGRICNQGVARYRELNSKHLETLSCGVNANHDMFLKVQTNQSKLCIALAARNKLLLDHEILAIKPVNTVLESYVEQCYRIEVQEGQSFEIEKCVALHTSRDHAISEPALDAEKAVERAPCFHELYHKHTLAWKLLWGQFDIEIAGQKEEKQTFRSLLILRLHIFHLLQTACHHTIDFDVGVPARGWHGEAYRGHIFWDELFILPLLNLRIPKISLALLKYRYRRLEEAKENAKKSGFQGAMFPWQSGSNGREESQKVHLNPKSGRWIPDNSSLQRHVNHAIAYNCWRYFEVTGDLDFLRSFGAEMLLEISRFLSSLCHFDAESKRYEIHCVMGPDEYHDSYPDAKEAGLNNNAYTNLMTVWVLSHALELLEILPEDHYKELRELLDLKDAEMERWDEISKKMKIPFHDDGIISQFEGYDLLKEFPWEEYEKKYDDLQRLDRILEAEGDTPNRFKVSKQADVLMLFYLLSADEIKQLFHRLNYEFDASLIPKNVNYYLNRTSHGSTLSRIVHSWVLSRQDRPASWTLFQNALESDITDIQGGTTAEGIHLGSMAGTVDIIQRCYVGIEPKRNVLRLDPCLPDTLKRMHFHIHYRGHSIEIETTQETLKISSSQGVAAGIKIDVQGKAHMLNPGESLKFELGF